MPPELYTVDRMAAIWVERMSRSVLSSELAAEFDRWITTDPRHVESYARMQALWQSDGFEDALQEAGDSPPLPAVPNDNDPLSWLARHRMMASAMAAAVLCLIFAVPLASNLLIDRVHYEARKGEARQFALVDGSHVTLSGGGVMDLRLTPWSREVKLEKGEAFFDVAHEKIRSFSVDMGTAQVEVLGTAFDIDRRSDGTVAVQVFRGLVGVHAGAGRQWRLPAGTGLEIAGDRVRSLPEPIGSAPAWVDGWYDAMDTPVSQLIEQLNRVSATRVTLADPALGNLLVSGRYQISKPEAVLDALAVTYNLTWRKAGDHYAISR
ncbi:DUF4880 domain-containing protein [Altererythrobacter indicus]|uniref:DUF4880 domain-containing protein n=1 Tax=Altericroceibacterium indicum TaxID=374177 RepID=A0A845AEZ1_9SPHN|nr:FecR domain-containing protein [Altericroceibacterium indicum]MXP27126.1 DUF4880 domain-containing protein [Altericroceibacterium indicum]